MSFFHLYPLLGVWIRETAGPLFRCIPVFTRAAFWVWRRGFFGLRFGCICVITSLAIYQSRFNYVLTDWGGRHCGTCREREIVSKYVSVMRATIFRIRQNNSIIAKQHCKTMTSTIKKLNSGTHQNLCWGRWTSVLGRTRGSEWAGKNPEGEPRWANAQAPLSYGSAHQQAPRLHCSSTPWHIHKNQI